MTVLVADVEFAEWLHQRMRVAGFGDNQSKLAAYLGTKASTVNAWFTRGAKPSPRMARKLAEVLRVSVDDVLVHAGHKDAEGDAEPDALPEWATLIGVLTPGDLAYVERMVRSLAETPVHPPEESGRA